VTAVLLANRLCTKRFETFNVATGDYLTVAAIAELVIECLELPVRPQLEYSGGDRGWKGDVPIVRLNIDRIRSLGWNCRLNSYQARREPVLPHTREIRNGKIFPIATDCCPRRRSVYAAMPFNRRDAKIHD